MAVVIRAQGHISVSTALPAFYSSTNPYVIDLSGAGVLGADEIILISISVLNRYDVGAPNQAQVRDYITFLGVKATDLARGWNQLVSNGNGMLGMWATGVAPSSLSVWGSGFGDHTTDIAYTWVKFGNVDKSAPSFLPGSGLLGMYGTTNSNVSTNWVDGIHTPGVQPEFPVGMTGGDFGSQGGFLGYAGGDWPNVLGLTQFTTVTGYIPQSGTPEAIGSVLNSYQGVGPGPVMYQGWGVVDGASVTSPSDYTGTLHNVVQQPTYGTVAAYLSHWSVQIAHRVSITFPPPLSSDLTLSGGFVSTPLTIDGVDFLRQQWLFKGTITPPPDLPVGKQIMVNIVTLFDSTTSTGGPKQIQVRTQGTAGRNILYQVHNGHLMGSYSWVVNGKTLNYAHYNDYYQNSVFVEGDNYYFIMTGGQTLDFFFSGVGETADGAVIFEFQMAKAYPITSRANGSTNTWQGRATAAIPADLFNWKPGDRLFLNIAWFEGGLDPIPNQAGWTKLDEQRFQPSAYTAGYGYALYTKFYEGELGWIVGVPNVAWGFNNYGYFSSGVFGESSWLGTIYAWRGSSEPLTLPPTVVTKGVTDGYYPTFLPPITMDGINFTTQWGVAAGDATQGHMGTWGVPMAGQTGGNNSAPGAELLSTTGVTDPTVEWDGSGSFSQPGEPNQNIGQQVQYAWECGHKAYHLGGTQSAVPRIYAGPVMVVTPAGSNHHIR